MPLAVLFIGVMGLARPVQARPPENADRTFDAWFESLRQPDGKFSCCSIADCHLAEARVGRPGYEVKIEGRWASVPPSQVVDHIPNPTGQAVVCYRYVRDPDGSGDVDRIGIRIFCFVRPPEA